MKEFPKSNWGPHRFAEEFNIVIQTYQPGFLDLYKLFHMFVNEDQANHWIKLVQWKYSRRDLKKKKKTASGKMLEHWLEIATKKL